MKHVIKKNDPDLYFDLFPKHRNTPDKIVKKDYDAAEKLKRKAEKILKAAMDKWFGKTD